MKCESCKWFRVMENNHEGPVFKDGTCHFSIPSPTHGFPRVFKGDFCSMHTDRKSPYEPEPPNLEKP